MQKETKAQRELNALIAERVPLQEKIASAQEKTVTNAELLADAERRQRTQQAYLNSLTNKRTEEYAKSKALLTATNKEANNLRSSSRGLNNSIGIWTGKLEKTRRFLRVLFALHLSILHRR